ncbi:nucleolar protein 12-domain-containing protein [Tricharina praecox]|uniref:nucleolar protein 12-domain-containing protein n=1 Tax=Tricharina praecox TaxID=43433 RepID=UPI002220A233|nr:nucleolar protein 12-domain-containing protein [Tricharina praecox]KAI5858351.1 nucleolar protein 12-domain-containing protein [Tricharina praecox]
MPPKRKLPERPAEITFDREARTEYLTGFHKRKLQRIAKAKEAAAAVDKLAAKDARKQLREQRKEELEELVEAGQKAARRSARVAAGGTWESDDEEEVGGDDEDGEWDGIGDEAVVVKLDTKELYVDEDKFTTVTVQEMDLDADSEEEKEEKVEGEGEGDAEAKEGEDGKDGKEKKKWPKKKKEKKKKFRYLNATERRADRFKLKQRKSKERAKFKGEKGDEKKPSGKGKPKK